MAKESIKTALLAATPILPSLQLVHQLPQLNKLDLPRQKQAELGQAIAIALAADVLKSLITYQVLARQPSFEIGYPLLAALTYYCFTFTDQTYKQYKKKE